MHSEYHNSPEHNLIDTKSALSLYAEHGAGAPTAPRLQLRTSLPQELRCPAARQQRSARACRSFTVAAAASAAGQAGNAKDSECPAGVRLQEPPHASLCQHVYVPDCHKGAGET